MRIDVVEHVDFEGAANIAKWSLKNGHQLARTRFYRGDRPPAMRDFDWLIVMGGPMSAYEDGAHPWLGREKAFIRDAIAAGKAVLGICLGAQLIADVIGGRAYRNSHEEIGWFPVRLTEEGKRSPMLRGLPDEIVPMHWHGDTFDLPASAVRLAQSNATPNQAFEFGGRTLGLQFHVEWSLGDIRALIGELGDGLKMGRYIQPAESILKRGDLATDIEGVMETILDNIAGLSIGI